jgi:type VI protein secretion system component VasK
MLSIILLLTFCAFVVLVFGPIVKKAGFPFWWALLMMLPVFNFVIIWVFAFMSWPAEQKQKAELTYSGGDN